MDRRARFRHELRAIVVSFKAALRSMRADRAGGADGEERASGAERRALSLLDGVAERFPDLSGEGDGRSALDAARRTVRSHDISVMAEDPDRR